MTPPGAPRPRTKVLVVIKGLGLGGAERLLVDALPFLNRSAFEYQVAYLLPWKSFLARDLERGGIPVHCLGGTPPAAGDARATPASWSAAARLPLALARLLALQRRERFDMIQADLPIAGILARVAGRWLSVPVIYTEHNLQERYHPITRRINAATYGWNRRVVAVSADVAASIERSGLRRGTSVVTLPNGVPVERVRSEAAAGGSVRAELEIPRAHLVVGTVAVFRRQKRLADWLDVAARIAARRDDVTFLLVGAGPLEAQVRARIDALGLRDRVRTPGFRPDGRRFLSAMDVFLMTSEFEGLPIALLEAMSLGVPAVSTAVGGIPEVLGRDAGLLAPVGAIDELRAGVERLLDDAALRERMGRSGAATIESNYHARDRVRAIERLYREVLGEAA